MSDEEAIDLMLDAPMIRFWSCPVCTRPRVRWKGDKAWCLECGRFNNDAVCRCGRESLVNEVTGRHVGCCGDCMPF